MDEFLKAIASGDIQAIFTLVQTFLTTGVGAALVVVFQKYRKYKSFTAGEIVDKVVEKLKPFATHVVEETTKQVIEPMMGQLETSVKNDKVLAESIALLAAKDTQGVVNNISKIENVDKEVIVKVDEKLVEEKAAEEIKQQEVENALAQLEKPEEKVVNTL